MTAAGGEDTASRRQRLGAMIDFVLADRNRLAPRVLRRRLREMFARSPTIYGSRAYQRRVWNALIRKKIGGRQRDMVDGRQLQLFSQ